MCGIVGIIDFKNDGRCSLLTNMLDALHHRGPDNTGMEYINDKSCEIGIGHVRLSIIDLTNNANQPYKYDHLVMSYNGEVYNFQEIRLELESNNYNFISSSDTEVIIKAYHCWGDDAIEKFNGMFAIAIYDLKKRDLKLIRDRAGVKPLYYYFHDGMFMFASEIKAFKNHSHFNKTISNEALGLYFQYGYIPQPLSIFEHVKKLKNGHILELSLNNQKVSLKEYWSVYNFYQKEKLKISEGDALTKLDEILNSSINYRMISDVPFGSFLSGGYDSSLVTAIMQKNSSMRVKTFTIGFDNDKYNESNYAKKVSDYLQTDHTDYSCTSKDALDLLPILPDVLDEPMADSSIIPTLIVSKLTKENVTVSLSADGGDELFAGYDIYSKIIKLNYLLKRIPFKNIQAQLIRLLSIRLANCNYSLYNRLSRVSYLLSSDNLIDCYNSLSNGFTPSIVQSLLLSPVLLKDNDLEVYKSLDCSLNDIDTLLSKDFQTSHIDQLLVKVDRATMYFSLEGREPLLDHRLIEFAAQLPFSLKLKNSVGKYLLKELTHKYIPKEIMQRPKMGFSVPLKDWLNGSEFNAFIEYYLDEEKIRNQGLFNVNEISFIKTAYLNKKAINFRQLWFILIFQMWYERWG